MNRSKEFLAALEKIKLEDEEISHEVSFGRLDQRAGCCGRAT